VEAVVSCESDRTLARGEEQDPRATATSLPQIVQRVKQRKTPAEPHSMVARGSVRAEDVPFAVELRGGDPVIS
jgi:hypothetical protein